MGRWRIGVVPAMKRRVRGRVAFRARRQITKTKPSIREETGGPAHSIALRGVHTHVPSRARARRCGLCACARGWLHWLWTWKPAVASTLRGHATSLEKKEKAGPLGGLFYVGWTWTNGQRSPRSRNQFNDRPWGETGVGGREGDLFGWYGCWSYVGTEIVDDGTEGWWRMDGFNVFLPLIGVQIAARYLI